jgi:hypothetical protein
VNYLLAVGGWISDADRDPLAGSVTGADRSGKAVDALQVV